MQPSSHPEAIADAPESYRNDFEIMNYALANTLENPRGVIAAIGAELLSNHVLFPRLLTAAAANSSFILSSEVIAAHLEHNPEFYKELLLSAMGRTRNYYDLLFTFLVRKKLLNDDHLYRKLAIKLLSHEGHWLQHFPELNNDREVVYTAVGSAPSALKYAGGEFQADKALVKEAVKDRGGLLEFFSEEFKDDNEIVLAAVKNDGRALKYASGRLRADPKIVEAALENKGWALNYADESFKHDLYYLRLSVNHHPGSNACRDFDEDQRGNKELLTIAVLKDPINFAFANRELRDDEELAQLAVQNDGAMLEHASSRLQGHERIVRLAVQSHGEALEHASPELRANKELVRLAVQNSGMALKFANDRLKNCPEVVRLALQQNPLALEFAGDTCRNDPELVNIAVYSDGNALRHVGRALQNNPQIIAAAINSVGAVAVRHIQRQVARESSSD